ncbi:MAG: gliding motility-associated C-terminal domain-containing protein [Nitrospirae bacterium]|nr:gliding motility-associated C-terminal domain-containing protein [Nitrospirota bacterium]
MEVAGVTGTGSSPQLVSEKTLGKEDFMMLLLKQLSYQDPLSPMDSMQFTSQLTQFSTLESLTNIDGTLNDVLAFQQSMQNASVADLIGRSVTVSGNSTYLSDKANISYELPKDASSVKVLIYDGAGKLIATKNEGSQVAGDNSIVWDGRDDAGNQMPQGTYTYEIEATDSAGSMEALTNSTGTVTGVVFENGSTYLVLDGDRNIYLSDIVSIQ